MTETKTFKHPLGLTSHFSTPGWSNSTDGSQRYDIYTDQSGYQEFPLSEWDIEVTFTKKPEQFNVGEKVQSKYSSTYTYTVLAQWKGTVIVVDEEDDEIELFDDDDLVYAVV